MTDHDALLAAIAAHPDEDTPRLAFADWLTEHAENDADRARAEFIRVQIERSRLPEDDDRQAELEARERRLIMAHGTNWRVPNGPLSNDYTRGFIERLNVAANDIFDIPSKPEEGEEPCSEAEDPPWDVKLFGAHPIRKLSFADYGFSDGYDDSGYSAEKAHDWHFFNRIESIVAREDGQRSHRLEDLLPILESPHLTRLKHLDIGGNPDLGDEGVSRILALSSVQNLESLRIGETSLGDAGLDALLARPWPHLRSLDLEGNEPLSAESLGRLFDSDLWSRLRTVDLGGLLWDDLRHEVLVRGLEQTRAESLALTDCGGQECDGQRPSVLALLAAKTWGPLRRLGLGEVGISADQLRDLLAHPSMVGITALSLGENGLTAEAMDALALAPGLAGLKRLNVRRNGGASTRLHLLAESPHLTGLTHLCADSHTEGLIEFVRSPNARHLRWLSIDGTISDELAEAIADSPFMENLTTLYGGYSADYGTGFTDRGAVALARSPHLKCLTFLDFPKQLTAVGQSALLSAEHMGWVGIMPQEAKEPDLYRRRYGDGCWNQIVRWDDLYWA